MSLFITRKIKFWLKYKLGHRVINKTIKSSKEKLDKVRNKICFHIQCGFVLAIQRDPLILMMNN